MSSSTSLSTNSSINSSTNSSDKDVLKWQDEVLTRACLSRTLSGDHICWTTYHPARPKNWPKTNKIVILSIVLTLEFYLTLIGTTGAIVVDYSMESFQKSSQEFRMVAFVFSYYIGQAFGNLFIPPYTDAHGRRPWYIGCSVLFSVTCLIIGLVPSIAGVFIGRFLSGLASSVPACVITGTISDLADAELRLWMVWLWNAISVVAQVLGPIYASYISETIGWRWIYYIASIVCAVFAIVILPLPETRPTMVLGREVRRVSETMGTTELKAYDPDSKTSAIQLICRAAKLLVTEPIVAVVTGLVSYSFGLIYLYTAALTPVYQEAYGFSKTQSSLAFIAIIVGALFSPLLRITDYRIASQRAANNQEVEPEDKLTGFGISAPILAAGLWLWAWSVPPAVDAHWAVGLVGLAAVGFATVEISYANVNYLVDAYTVYAASAVAACEFVRAAVGAVAPLFAQAMFTRLGPNIAGTVLAALATLFCIAPVVLIRFGSTMRIASPFAKRSAIVLVAVGG